uniref:Uncharacterized protein n=1 Tax=uncultured marine virus TaxID=186617 RepID=A0A0F7L225_9VIRU|nr:hypothetical protein [uncultured marine virus]
MDQPAPNGILECQPWPSWNRSHGWRLRAPRSRPRYLDRIRHNSWLPGTLRGRWRLRLVADHRPEPHRAPSVRPSQRCQPPCCRA